jgi:hypothetical protein
MGEIPSVSCHTTANRAKKWFRPMTGTIPMASRLLAMLKSALQRPTRKASAAAGPMDRGRTPPATSEAEDGLGSETVEASTGYPIAGETADKRKRHHQQDTLFAEASGRLQVRHDERGQAAVGHGPRGVHLQQTPEGRVLGHGEPGDRSFARVLVFGHGNVGYAPQEQQGHESSGPAEEEDRGELPGVGLVAEHECREEERGDAGTIGAKLVHPEVAAADAGGNEVGDPRKPGAAGKSPGQVEGEQQCDEEGESRSGIQEPRHQGHHRHQEDEPDPRGPSAKHEPLVPDPRDELRRRDLRDRHDGHQAGHQPQDGGRGPQRFRVQDHRAREDHLEGQRVEERERIRVGDSFRQTIRFSHNGSLGPGTAGFKRVVPDKKPC